MKLSVIIRGKEILEHQDDSWLEEILDRDPFQIILFIEGPLDLKAVEIISKLEIPNITPMVQLLSAAPMLLASAVNQALETLGTKRFYLLVYDGLHGHQGFDNYIETFYFNIKKDNEDTLEVFICAPASNFLHKTSAANTFAQFIKEQNTDPHYVAMFSDSPESIDILQDEEFQNLLTEAEYQFILMKLAKNEAWDIASILDLEKPLIFWNTETFLAYCNSQKTESPLPKGALAVALIKVPKATVWDNLELNGKPIRKIVKVEAVEQEEYLIRISPNKHGTSVGEISGGGFIDLASFKVKIL